MLESNLPSAYGQEALAELSRHLRGPTGQASRRTIIWVEAVCVSVCLCVDIRITFKIIYVVSFLVPECVFLFSDPSFYYVFSCLLALMKIT